MQGPWNLSKLTVLYDSNAISIEGNTDIAFREDVSKRAEAFGFKTLYVDDGNDLKRSQPHWMQRQQMIPRRILFA